jgi:UDP-N-acetylglucosamine:LPS N-acetylglucosamine transferase
MSTVLVATAGGHLAQLFELAPRLPFDTGHRVWVTSATPQSRSLLAGEDAVFVPEVRPRDVKAVLREVPRARRLLQRHRAETVVSTGAALALGYLLPAVSMGIPAHYVESSARVEGPSLTGRILERVPRVHLYRQYEHAARGRWKYAGTVFAGFSAIPRCDPPTIRRAVVVLGTVDEAFRRLVERLVAILPPGAEVLWQTGTTPVDDLDIEPTPFLPDAELKAAMAAADVVVTHGGCGAVLDALAAGRSPVVVPRRLAHGECVDDHQRQLAEWVAARGLAVLADADELSWSHLETASRRSVVRVADPPVLSLVR